jgi:predicted secreted protein
MGAPSLKTLRTSSDNLKEENPMVKKKTLLASIIALVLAGNLWAGDTASFVDLGFSPDGRTYMFAQYGIQSGTLKPWSDLFVVDVPNNNYVPNGKFSYIHTGPVAAGQDGSGALYRILTRNSAIADRYGINYCFQGQLLYVSLEGPDVPATDTIEFRDFDASSSYRATLVPTVEGSGDSLKSSFYINLEKKDRDGRTRFYTVGTPQLKRPLIASYRIRKVMIAPQDGSMILVIEMKKKNGADWDIRYMVEAVRL